MRSRSTGTCVPGEIEVEVAPAGGEAPTDDMFKLVVKRGGQVVEEFDRVTTNRGKQNVATIVNAESKTIKIEDVGTGAIEKPDAGTVALMPPAPPAAAPSSSLTADDYVGDVAERTGFGGLEAVDEVTMVAVPDLMSAYQQGAIDLETVQAVQLGMIAHCELMGDRVAILDPPPGLNAQQIKEWRVDKARYDSKYATLYWPWIKVFDPATRTTQYVPPSGHVAGIWGRNDDTRGVHKAPANEVIRGAVELETADHEERARTCSTRAASTASGRSPAAASGSTARGRCPATRRGATSTCAGCFNFLEESILNGTQWVVFEPNDDALWARIRRTVNDFLVNQWRAGALFGLTPDEAFFVKCDRETNPSRGHRRRRGRLR